MRKIEEAMLQAITYRERFTRDNTNVTKVVDGCQTIYLHGHPIATINHNACELSISDCGWQTVTTKSRLNAILNHFNLANISQKAFVWYRGGCEWGNKELIKY